ncbi:hypothetical protein PAXRUDRAFT_21029 [Paxillus rubicundulus Ve08.2h10]|uniref:Uncharacterized protein n=1 Tax=Paxillus rubicundulus Ve08.2h10 TaxID=930991 RepID=A0A0D0D887_9AGAM|nr:hypothetical protein PAXRUDRAFT_21029 [Paxillus rubicundulus Ve08.2h10]
MKTGGTCLEDGVDKELKAASFSSSNVMALLFPSLEESPGTPFAIEGDPDAHAQAGVQVGQEVMDWGGSGDGTTDRVVGRKDGFPQQEVACLEVH